ncbi:MAG: beta galactosidase jelly roll domain-containing protein [Proteobacteria bacterium]|nr:beta galactosidase jelly roll domain-containing protein [Pseudomonadota bacterium]
MRISSKYLLAFLLVSCLSCREKSGPGPVGLPGTRYPVMPGSVFASAVLAPPVNPSEVSQAAEIVPFREVESSRDLSGEWRYLPDPRSRGEEDSPPWFSPGRDDSDWDRIPVPSHFARFDSRLSDFYRPVWFRRHFALEEEAISRSRAFDLVFEGVDYFARVWLNGRFLGEHEGYFNPFRFEVSGLLQTGDNLLVVEVTNPYDYGLKGEAPFLALSEKIWIKGVLNFHDCRPGGIMLSAREAQTRGTGGIIRPVFLKAYGPLTLDQVFITPELSPDNSRATVKLEYIISNRTGKTESASVMTSISGETFASPVTRTVLARVRVTPGPHRLSLSVPVDDPTLWWPAGYPELGDPDLYRAETWIYSPTEVSDRRADNFGIRTVRMTETGPESFIWYVNGERLFLRGSTTLIPTGYLAEADALYPRDFELLREAGINFLRPYSHVDPPVFYDYADRFGVGIVSEFSLQWEYSPCGFSRSNGDPDLAGNPKVIARMLAEAMYLHYNHPSILAWSVHNEPYYFAAGINPESQPAVCPAEPFREGQYVPFTDSSLNYSLDQELLKTAQGIDPTRPVRLASGVGDQHLYLGWYQGTADDIAGVKAPFPTEFGTQGVAYSSEEWLRTELGPKFFPPLSKDAGEEIRRAWLFHDAQLASLGVYLGRPDGETYTDFREFAFASQVYQAEVNRMYVERFRITKYNPTGAFLQFTFLQWWPSITWGFVDYRREPLLAYEWFKRLNQPILAAAELPKRIFSSGESLHIPLSIVNDRHLALAGVKLRVLLEEEEDSLIIRGDPAAWGDSPSYFSLPPAKPILISTGTSVKVMNWAERESVFDLSPDSVYQAEPLDFSQPFDILPAVHHYHLTLALTGPGGEELSRNWYHFLSVPDPKVFDPPLGLSLYRQGDDFNRHPRFNLSLRVLNPDGSGRSALEVALNSRFTDPVFSETGETDQSGNIIFAGLSPGAHTINTSSGVEYTQNIWVNGSESLIIRLP